MVKNKKMICTKFSKRDICKKCLFLVFGFAFTRVACSLSLILALAAPLCETCQKLFSYLYCCFFLRFDLKICERLEVKMK